MTEETAVTVKTPKSYQEALESTKYRERLDLLLAGTDVTPDRFIGMVVQSLARQPKLLAKDVDRDSLLLAVLTAAEMGLVPTGAFGGGWLVPYYDKDLKAKRVQFITDWRAFIKMAFRSGQLRGAWAHPVYEGDEFWYELGDKPALHHKPVLDPATRGDMTHVYAVAHLTTGERVFEVMTLAETEVIRKRSRAGDSGPWIDDPIEMRRKTAVKRLFKYLPVAITPQLAQALEAEDAWEEEGRTVTVAPVSERRARVLSEITGEAVEPAAEGENGDVDPAPVPDAETIGGRPVEADDENLP